MNPVHEDVDSETEFEEVQETLRNSLSQESLTWMRHVIRVQAEDVLRTKLDRVILNEVNKYMEENLTKVVQSFELKTKGLEETIVKLNRALCGVNKDLAKKNAEIEKLKSHFDTTDQKQRETRVRVTGVDEENEENLQKKVVKIAKNKLGMKIKEEDLQEVYRAGKKKTNKTRDIVIQFTKKCTRDVYLQHRKKIPRTPDPKARMYINEDLTEYRQKLLFDARQVAKNGKIKGAWSQHGNIMILKKEGGPTTVRDYNELRTAAGIPGYAESNEKTSDISGELSSQYSISDYDDYSV